MLRVEPTEEKSEFDNDEAADDDKLFELIDSASYLLKL